MTWKPERASLPVASVAASSGDAAVTTDSDLRTRWNWDCAEDQWVTYDLGRQRDLAGVSSVWYSRETVSAPVIVELSTDGRVFEEVDRMTIEGRATQTSLSRFLPQSARYVRLSLSPLPGSVSQVSLYEVGLHGEK
jgi:hypothetical protein